MNVTAGFKWIVLFSVCLAGCGQEPANPYATAPTGRVRDANTDPYGISPNMIKFQDQLESNATPEIDLFDLKLIDRDGQPASLKEIANGKNLVLVMTRGYAGSICPYCSTQVSRLIANYAELERRNTQVVVVYPIETQADAGKSDEFVQRAVSMLATKKDLPFPILLDVELKAVDLLGIRKDLSKPATYILDGTGRVQFAYVSNTLADRPSVQALLEQLDKINKLAERS